MSLTNAYVQSPGKVEDFFSKIRDGQAPTQFTQQLLKDLGYASSNDRLYIPLLKELGFLSLDGHPTSRYRDYRDHSRSRAVMGQALKETYEDIFLIKSNPTRDDRGIIQGKFKSFHNVGDRSAQMMTNTFLALLDLADIDTSHTPRSKQEKTEKADITAPPKETPLQSSKTPSLYYNIQIHLPATKDVEVFNAIFKSLKEHLY